MPKTLVVCIDGTWNVPGQTDKGRVTDEESKTLTNVARTWEALAKFAIDKDRSYGSISRLIGQEGMAIYLNGVGGVGTKITKLYAGATGSGTSERIRDGYRFLAERWEPGDRILGFGFRRGVFAVCSLAGFINYVILPKTSTLIKEEELVLLYEMYRKKRSVQAGLSMRGLISWDFGIETVYKPKAKFKKEIDTLTDNIEPWGV